MEINKNKLQCRFCKTDLKNLFVSLGASPLSNAYLKKDQLHKKETTYPLDVYICETCFLVQLPEFESPENIFKDYAYFSSYSDTWLKHTKEYADKMIELLTLDKNSSIVEIASNDGCLLKNFVDNGIPALGIEPAKNVAEVAIRNGVPTDICFFGTETAKKMVAKEKQADLLLGNNVLAHVPDINDFVAGLKILLKPDGVITIEFPHLMRLVEGIQFDTIYHEHFSYLSLITVQEIFKRHGLEIFDVEEVPTHGGSLRIYAKHKEDSKRAISPRVLLLKQRELGAGYADINFYTEFKNKVAGLKDEIIEFLKSIKDSGKTILGYGAPAKGNTLLNYCGITTADIPFTVDRNPYKQGRYLPGSHIPIKSPDNIKDIKPKYVLILPWNIKEEIIRQLDYIRDWKGKFVTFIPKIDII